MIFHYTLRGSFHAPEGSTTTGGSIILPDGRCLKLWEQIELSDNQDAEDYQNLTFDEVVALDCYFDGEMCEFEEADQ